MKCSLAKYCWQWREHSLALTREFSDVQIGNDRTPIKFICRKQINDRRRESEIEQLIAPKCSTIVRGDNVRIRFYREQIFSQQSERGLRKFSCHGVSGRCVLLLLLNSAPSGTLAVCVSFSNLWFIFQLRLCSGTLCSCPPRERRQRNVSGCQPFKSKLPASSTTTHMSVLE
jgi:hypothetical protein